MVVLGGGAVSCERGTRVALSQSGCLTFLELTCAVFYERGTSARRKTDYRFRGKLPPPFARDEPPPPFGLVGVMPALGAAE